MKKRPQVAVIMGSDSDLEMMKETINILKDFDIPYDVKILSAHRSPEMTSNFAKKAEKMGVKVIIAAAGGAAHLAGVIASQTILPVIGVPMDTKSLKGIDSLLSTVQMPAGIPVATVAIGAAGAKNAAILAAQILSAENPALRNKLKTFKQKLAASIKEKNRKLFLKSK